jgi:hypothetical protein
MESGGTYERCQRRPSASPLRVHALDEPARAPRACALDRGEAGVVQRVVAAQPPWGNAQFKDYIADWDATVVSRLRQTGAVILGKTNAHFMLADFAQRSTTSTDERTTRMYDISLEGVLAGRPACRTSGRSRAGDGAHGDRRAGGRFAPRGCGGVGCARQLVHS